MHRSVPSRYRPTDKKLNVQRLKSCMGFWFRRRSERPPTRGIWCRKRSESPQTPFRLPSPDRRAFAVLSFLVSLSDTTISRVVPYQKRACAKMSPALRPCGHSQNRVLKIIGTGILSQEDTQTLALALLVAKSGRLYPANCSHGQAMPSRKRCEASIRRRGKRCQAWKTLLVHVGGGLSGCSPWPPPSPGSHDSRWSSAPGDQSDFSKAASGRVINPPSIQFRASTLATGCP